MSVTFQVKKVISMLVAIDMLWIKFIIHKIMEFMWNPALLLALSAKCFSLLHSVRDGCLAGAS